MEIIDIGKLTNRITPSVEAPGGGDSKVRAFGLFVDGKYVVWLFDDDFDYYHWGESDRSYTTDMKNSKSDHILVIPDVASESYTVTRYNTWTGNSQQDPNPVDREDGDLRILVGEFAIDNDYPDLTWDGADILLIIEPND